MRRRIVRGSSSSVTSLRNSRVRWTGLRNRECELLLHLLLLRLGHHRYNDVRRTGHGRLRVADDIKADGTLPNSKRQFSNRQYDEDGVSCYLRFVLVTATSTITPVTLHTLPNTSKGFSYCTVHCYVLYSTLHCVLYSI